MAPEVVALCLGEAASPDGSTRASTQVSLGMLGPCLLMLGAKTLGIWEANCDMHGTCRSVGVRMYNQKVAFWGFRGGGGGLLLHLGVITQPPLVYKKNVGHNN